MGDAVKVAGLLALGAGVGAAAGAAAGSSNRGHWAGQGAAYGGLLAGVVGATLAAAKPGWMRSGLWAAGLGIGAGSLLLYATRGSSKLSLTTRAASPGQNPALDLIVGDAVDVPLTGTPGGSPTSSNGGVVSLGGDTSSGNVQIVAVAPGSTTVSVPMAGAPDTLIPVIVAAA